LAAPLNIALFGLVKVAQGTHVITNLFEMSGGELACETLLVYEARELSGSDGRCVGHFCFIVFAPE
jgi:hypothetical protein